MTLQQINDTWGKYIWRVANNYHTGIHDAEDVYNDLLIALFLSVRDGKLPTDNSEKSKKTVVSFIISRAINIVRMENRRQRHLKKKITFLMCLYGWEVDSSGEDILSSRNSENDEIREMELEELVHNRLSERDAIFINEVAFPSTKTVKYAMDQQVEKQQDGCLRMGTRNLKITTNHVANVLSGVFGMVMSPATISRVKQNARQCITEDEIYG